MHNVAYPPRIGRVPRLPRSKGLSCWTSHTPAAWPLNPVPATVEVDVARPHSARIPALGLVHPGPPHLAGASRGTAVAVVAVDVPPAAEPAAVDAERVGVSSELGHRPTVIDEADTPTEITDLGNRYGQAAGMPRQRKGWAILTRLPVREEAIVRRRAAEQGLSYSDVIANAVAVGLGHPAIYEPRHSPDDQLLAG